jgi:hypothetical protein
MPMYLIFDHPLHVITLTVVIGHAIVQAVSCWLPTVAAWVGFVVDKVVLGQVFSKYFGFPCQSSFHQLLQSPSCIVWDWYSRPVSGCSTKWTQSHPTKENKKKSLVIALAKWVAYI